MKNTTIYFGADHRGFHLKERLKAYLATRGFIVRDLGAHKRIATDDYATYGLRVARIVAKDPNSMGIVICGSGIGISVAANKIQGIRAGLAHSVAQAKAGRRDDLINILALAADFISTREAERMVNVFLTTPPGTSQRYHRRARSLNRFGTKT
ncbi:MAG: RpiB/LacA/LacB family sugar-phosphate isomerase [Patescibacteria group bacterium]|jgi:ribose 5-phosphate isomerase B